MVTASAGLAVRCPPLAQATLAVSKPLHVDPGRRRLAARKRLRTERRTGPMKTG